MKQNCWDYKQCGREPGGKKAEELGVCPAAIEQKINTINSGKNGGRSCWAIAGTFCNGRPNGTFTLNLSTCMKCDFFKNVKAEEGDDYKNFNDILKELYKKK